MKTELTDDIKRILLFQLIVFLFVWLIWGMEFTAPAVIKSSDWPVLSQGLNFTISIPAIYLLFLAVTTAPLTEELSFRGPFWILANRSRSFADFLAQHPAHFWLVIVASGLAFGLLHTNYSLEWRFVTAFFGATWVWFVLKHKKIWPTIMMHYGWNIFLATLELFLSPYIRADLAQFVVFH